MYRHSLIAAALALVGPLPGRAVAQEPGVRPDEMGGPQRVMQFVMNRRARLGLKVNLRARSSDSSCIQLPTNSRMAMVASGPRSEIGRAHV